ncbi:MAG: PP2C family protein-serine/threonine phosphatase, partial [Blastocatellia bacterium]
MAKLPTINLALYAQTHVGMVRSGNEDNFLILDLSTGRSWTVGEKEPHDLLTYSQGNYGSLLAVSDGMGGALAGEVASRMAVETVRDRMLRLQAHSVYGKLSFAERLRLSIEEANLLINRESQTNPAHKGLGATFTAVAAHGDQVYFAQVGDSRAYLIRQGKIHRITKDQSLTQQLIDAGQVTEEEAQTHSYRNVILQALGAHSRVNVEVNALALCNLDTLVLCSDGASGKISQDEIARVVREAPDFKSACQQMINLANQRGGGDNITVVVAQFSSPSLALPSGDSIAPQSLGRSPDTPTEINWGAGMPTDPSEKADSPDGSAPEDAETQATEPLPAPPTRSKPYKFFEEDNTMDNLTIEERLVKEAPDTNPMVGHKVVIFEQVGEGSEFRQVLKPGERFEKRRKSLFGPAPVYFAYAVNTDQQLRLEFSDRFLHKDQVHSFDLTFRVEYCAADDDDGMRRLAERVNSDPLKRLQDEIKRVLGRAIAGLEWETIKTNCVADNFKEVAHAVLTDAAAGQASSNFNNLCRFATELGIKLKAIELICNLVEEDIR